MLSTRTVALSCMLLGTAGAQDWRGLDGPHRMYSGAFDAARGRVLTVASGRETREWNGSHWLHRPLPLLAAEPLCLAFDEARGVTVAITFSLPFALPFANQTWECDGTTWTRRVTATAPALQPDGSCVYDVARGRTVHVSSSAPGGTFSTWEWDGQNWLLRPTPAALTGRLGVGLAYDVARGRTVLFGGLGAGGAFGAALAETWEWDGATWLQRQPPVAPPARARASMAYDSARQVCVLFGGSQTADTWEYDGITWTQRTGPMPPARTTPGLVYDRHRARTVLFGGRGVPFWFGDVWEWDGAAWTQRLADVQPPSRVYPALAYSAARDRLVMYGGDLGTGVAWETWEWDGAAWAQMPLPQQLSPPSRLGHRMWSDGSDVFVFGGTTPGSTAALNDTWRWNGTAWSQAAVGPAPSARSPGALAYEPTTGGAILFGGSIGLNPGTFFGDTWRWLPSGWSQLGVSPAPSPRTAAAVASDTARGRIVLWGGVGATASFDDTWEWDGVGWQLQNPPHRPPLGQWQSMAFEPSLGVVVLLVRPSFLSQTMETWVWTTTDWVRVDTPTRLHAVPGIGVIAAPGRVFAHDGEHLYALTMHPPLVESYGAGCPGGALRLVADAWPRPGTSEFALASSGHAPNATVLHVVGTARAALPVGGCTLLVQPGGPLVATLADGHGISHLPLPLAPLPALLGLRACAQAFGLGPSGLQASAGLDMTIGN